MILHKTQPYSIVYPFPGLSRVVTRTSSTQYQAGVFIYMECEMKLRYKREPIRDDRRRCNYCQNIISGHPLKKNCSKCNSWLAFNGWREAIIKRDGGKCAYCGSIAKRPHIDHIYPLSKGGSNTAVNLVTSCGSCNIKKGDKPLRRGLEASVVRAVKKRNKKRKIPNDMYFPADYGRSR